MKQLLNEGIRRNIFTVNGTIGSEIFTIIFQLLTRH